jgi:hypothetical protein
MSDSLVLGAWRQRAQGRGDDGPGRRPPRPAVLGAVAIALACALLGGSAVLNHSAVHNRGALGGASAPTEPAPGATGAPPCPALAPGLHADVDGDGCDDEVSFVDGVLTAGSTRMRVGAPGDQVALGRWTCGQAAVALLRPSTGEVFRFDGWATPAKSVAAVELGRIEGAVGLRADTRDGGHCDDLAVTRASGPPVLLPYRPVAG